MRLRVVNRSVGKSCSSHGETRTDPLDGPKMKGPKVLTGLSGNGKKWQ